jgi:hypothetical protein
MRVAIPDEKHATRVAAQWELPPGHSCLNTSSATPYSHPGARAAVRKFSALTTTFADNPALLHRSDAPAPATASTGLKPGDALQLVTVPPATHCRLAEAQPLYQTSDTLAACATQHNLGPYCQCPRNSLRA